MPLTEVFCGNCFRISGESFVALGIPKDAVHDYYPGDDDCDDFDDYDD